ncbi:hypothetical protein D3C72_1697050 [compost metagenome]
MPGLLQRGDGVYRAEAGAHDAHRGVPGDRAGQRGDGVRAIEVPRRVFQVRKRLRRQVAVAQHGMAREPRRAMLGRDAHFAIGQRRNASHAVLHVRERDAQR